MKGILKRGLGWARRNKSALIMMVMMFCMQSAMAALNVDDSGTFLSTIGCSVLNWCKNLIIPVGGIAIISGALMWMKGTQMNELMHNLVTIVLVVTVGMAGLGILGFIGSKFGIGAVCG